MKKVIAIFIFAVILSACSKSKPEKVEDDFLKVPTTETTSAEVKTYTPIYKAVSTSSANPTYWYVVFTHSVKDENISDEIWHYAVALNAPYFDFVEARKQLPAEVTGKVYYEFILQINKESYETFITFREENKNKFAD